MILMLEIRFHEFEVFCIEQRGKVAIVEGGLNFCLQIKVLPPHRFSTWRDLKYINGIGRIPKEWSCKKLMNPCQLFTLLLYTVYIYLIIFIIIYII